jgi:hypothetical protein
MVSRFNAVTLGMFETPCVGCGYSYPKPLATQALAQDPVLLGSTRRLPSSGTEAAALHKGHS